MKIKEITIYTHYELPGFEKCDIYNDCLTMSMFDISYEKRSEDNKLLLNQWSYHTSRDFFVNNFERVCELINDIDFEAPVWECEKVGTFEILVNYDDGSTKSKQYCYTFEFNGLIKLVEAIKYLVPNHESISELMDDYIPQEAPTEEKIKYFIIGGILFKSVGRKTDYIIYKSQHDSWEPTDYEHGECLLPDVKILKEEDALKYALELGMTKKEFYKD